MDEQMRKEFESWAEAYGHDISRSEINPDDYHDLVTELAFDVWKAARAEPERNVEPVVQDDDWRNFSRDLNPYGRTSK